MQMSIFPLLSSHPEMPDIISRLLPLSQRLWELPGGFSPNQCHIIWDKHNGGRASSCEAGFYFWKQSKGFSAFVAKSSE